MNPPLEVKKCTCTGDLASLSNWTGSSPDAVPKPAAQATLTHIYGPFYAQGLVQESEFPPPELWLLPTVCSLEGRGAPELCDGITRI